MLGWNAAVGQQPAPLQGISLIASGEDEPGSATFEVLIAREGESAAATEALVGDIISVAARLRPEAVHVGLPADLFVVHRHGANLAMLGSDGKFLPWDGSIPTLVPARRATVLAPSNDLPIFSGRLGAAGTHMVYLGYRPRDGQLHYTPHPRRLEVTDTSPLEAARALYAARIAPDILPLCLRCHYAGGPAPTALHTFVPLDQADHMALNLVQFARLLQAPRGKDYILGKVQNTPTHGGNVVVPANSDDFLALERFLVLLIAATD